MSTNICSGPAQCSAADDTADWQKCRAQLNWAALSSCSPCSPFGFCYLFQKVLSWQLRLLPTYFATRTLHSHCMLLAICVVPQTVAFNKWQHTRKLQESSGHRDFHIVIIQEKPETHKSQINMAGSVPDINDANAHNPTRNKSSVDAMVHPSLSQLGG